MSTVQQLRNAPHVRAVYDLTIAYGHKNKFLAAPGMWETLSQPSLSNLYKFHVHVKRYPIEFLPQTDGELAQWLEDRWMEKGDKLEGLRDSLARGIDWGGEGASN